MTPSERNLVLRISELTTNMYLPATATSGKSTDDARYDEHTDGTVAHVEPGFYVEYARKQSTNARYHGLQS